MTEGHDSDGGEDPAVKLATLGEIALEVAHELRNLLLVIDASNYLARKDPEASAPHLEKIDRSIRAARGIVDDLFLLAREEPLPFEDTELADVTALARTELQDGAAEWIDHVSGVRFRAHDRLLARLLKVLYENAIQVSADKKPRIETRATAQTGSIVIDVEDDGPGVPPATAARIFEPLVTSRAGGTGMGLPLARRIAVAHGGGLELIAGRGIGACFRVTIPRG